MAVCASDLATIGIPNTTCSAPQTVEVDNSCTESPVPGGEDLSAQIGQSGTEEVTVGYGSEAEVHGSLEDAGGATVPGATICVKSATIGVEPTAQPVGTVKTDSSGHFTYAVPAGPDREVVLGYRQANVVASKRWITFRRAVTGPKGNFSAAYRFHSTTRKTNYRFRAIVPTQDHYPYVEGHSKPVSVLVRPASRRKNPDKRQHHRQGGKKRRSRSSAAPRPPSSSPSLPW